MGPLSGVFQAVVFMLPFGSCSVLLIVCVRQRTGLRWWLRCTTTLVHWSHYHKPVRWRTQTINKALHEPNGSIKTTACKYPWWWAHEGPKHVGKRREKGNKDIVQKVASVGNSYCNIDVLCFKNLKIYLHCSALHVSDTTVSIIRSFSAAHAVSAPVWRLVHCVLQSCCVVTAVTT